MKFFNIRIRLTAMAALLLLLASPSFAGVYTPYTALDGSDGIYSMTEQIYLADEIGESHWSNTQIVAPSSKWSIGVGEEYEDYEDYEAGKIPEDIPCGVLSEDAVYDLLTENRELILEMLDLAKERIR